MVTNSKIVAMVIVLASLLIAFQNCSNMKHRRVEDSIISQLKFQLDTKVCSSSSLLGEWRNDSDVSDKVRFKENCSGFSTQCRSQFYFAAEHGLKGKLLVHVQSSGASNCLQPGEHICSFEFNESKIPRTLSIDCGGLKIDYSQVPSPN